VKRFRWDVAAATLCLWMGLPRISSPAQEAAPADPAKLRATYAEQLDKINKAADAAVTNLQNQYVQSLIALQKAFQDKGQLEPLLIVKKEQTRFIFTPVVDEAHLSAAVPELQTLQVAYRKALAGIPVKKAKDILAIVGQYKKALTGIQEKLTKAGNLDAAIAVKNEAEGLDTRPEVTAARFTVADDEAKNPPEPPKEELKPAATNAAPPKRTAQAAPKKKYTGKAENYIRQRFNDLCDVLLKQEMDKAVEFVDPRTVKERGAERVRKQLKWVLPFLKWTDSPDVKLSAGAIEVDDKEETATVIPKVWVNNQWREMNKANWVQVEGDWFLVLGGGPAAGDEPPPPPTRPFKRKHGNR